MDERQVAHVLTGLMDHLPFMPKLKSLKKLLKTESVGGVRT